MPGGPATRNPFRGGREALEVLRAHRPELRAILRSGYDPAPEGPIRLDPDPVPFLAKPFTPRELLRRIREILDGSAPPASA